MKTIELNTAAVDNFGRRVEAGKRVAVGTRPNQISAERAKELVARASAVAIREKKAASPAPKPRAKKVGSKAKVAPVPTPAPTPTGAANPDVAKP